MGFLLIGIPHNLSTAPAAERYMDFSTKKGILIKDIITKVLITTSNCRIHHFFYYSVFFKKLYYNNYSIIIICCTTNQLNLHYVWQRYRSLCTSFSRKVLASNLFLPAK